MRVRNSTKLALPLFVMFGLVAPAPAYSATPNYSAPPITDYYSAKQLVKSCANMLAANAQEKSPISDQIAGIQDSYFCLGFLASADQVGWPGACMSKDIGLLEIIKNFVSIYTANQSTMTGKDSLQAVQLATARNWPCK